MFSIDELLYSPACLSSEEDKPATLRITEHARLAWQKRASDLRLDPSDKAMMTALGKSVKEQPKSRSTQWHLFTRQIVKGETCYLACDGWRFVLSEDIVVTIERVRPEENCITFPRN